MQHLIEERGRNARLIDWLDDITADCPKKQAHNMNDPCGARFPDLPRVLQVVVSMSAFGAKADMAYCSANVRFDPKRTLKFNFENKNGAALKPRQVVMQKR